MIPSEVKVDIVMSWTTSRALWFPVLVAAAVLAACSADPDPASDLPPGVTEGSPNVLPATVTPSATPTAGSGGCANEDAVASDPVRQIGPSTEADIDGDDVADRVSLAADPSGPEGCRTFLVIKLGSASTVAAPVWEIGSQGGLPQPRVHGFIDIDGRPGAEVVVDEAAGASTQFVGAFVLAGEELRRITIAGDPEPETAPGGSDLFPYGGSVGHLSAVDCTEDGVVISAATPGTEPGDAGTGNYDIERRFYTLDGSVLKKGDVEVHHVPIDQLERFREYAAGPFGSC